MTFMDETAGTSRARLARASRHHLTLELAETARLALPMALTQLSQIAMMTTDLAFIGRLGGEAVAAAALAGTVYFVSFTFGMGLTSAVAPLAAQAFGADHVLARLWRIDWSLMRQLFVIGLPISLAFLLEYGMFSAAALLMGLIGTSALAAHQIALQVTAILFMIPFGISMAATVRVGQAVGRNDAAGVRRAGLVAMLLGIAIALVLTFAVVATRFDIAAFFLGTAADNAAATIALAATLLLVGASFFVTDAMQSIAVGSLRGLKDTHIPLLFAGMGYWLIGFPLSWLLGFHTGLGATGVWVGLSIGTAVYATLLVLRFQRLTRTGAPP